MYTSRDRDTHAKSWPSYWWQMSGEFLPVPLLYMWLFSMEMVHLWYLWGSSKCPYHTNLCCAYRCQSNDSKYCVGHNVYLNFSVTSAPPKGKPPFPSVTLPKLPTLECNHLLSLRMRDGMVSWTSVEYNRAMAICVYHPWVFLSMLGCVWCLRYLPLRARRLWFQL